MTDTTRPVSTFIGRGGRPTATTTTSPVSNKTYAQVTVPPHRVIPIVFVPGIMGSNLKAKHAIFDPSKKDKQVIESGKKIWNVDSSTSVAGWALANPKTRQLLLNKDVVAVDDSGAIETKTSRGDYEGKTPNSRIPLAVAKQRGWGTVSKAFYGDFLDHLQWQLKPVIIPGRLTESMAGLLNLSGTTPSGAHKKVDALQQADILKISRFQFPVHAVGYNWLQSNLISGQYLADKIKNEIIPAYHGINGQICTQVIVITHSMGGLVARAAAITGGASDQILGVIHGVMPGDGAAAFYKRLAAGFSSEHTGLKPYAESKALGHTARDTTPVIAYNPGPLELAPNKLYNGGKPWLFIKDKQGKTLKALPTPGGDPYAEIYGDTQSVWRAINPEWLNPAGFKDKPSAFLEKYFRTLNDAAKYHKNIQGKLHPQSYVHYSDDPTQKAWGTITWQVEAGETYYPSAQMYGMAAAPALPRWIPHPNRQLMPIDTWTFPYTPRGSTRDVKDAKGEIRMTVLPFADAGDGTVPSATSGAQMNNLPGCQLACAHKPGYEHSASYNADTVRKTVLDAIIRMIKPLKLD